MRYIKIIHNKIQVLNTDNFRKVLKEEFKEGYDTTDYVFEENLNIRVFLKAGSIFEDLEETILYKVNNETVDIFKGTVIFSKDNGTIFTSLKAKDIQIITTKIINNNGQLEINY
ncbi:MAG: hypothetical protein ACI4P1_03350 [Erysipelotrichaceae bacterium]